MERSGLSSFLCVGPGDPGLFLLPGMVYDVQRNSKGDAAMDRPFPALTVTDKAARALRSGHPWVFAGEVLTPGDPCPDGDIVDVCCIGRWANPLKSTYAANAGHRH